MRQSKDLLGIKDLDYERITCILDEAVHMKKLVLSADKSSAILRGKAVATLFYENSTRTRLSFELAAQYIGAHVVGMASGASSVAKGENLIDTGKTVEAMGVDAIIIRHQLSGAPALLAKNLRCSVINAGDGAHEHPTQALLDMFTIREHYGTLSGLNIAIVGDILHSRVARSNLWGLTQMGANVRLCAPCTLMPAGIAALPCVATSDLHTAVRDADVVMTLRIQSERQQAGLFPSLKEYNKYYGINDAVMALANKDALLMHPGPCNRGVELESGTYDNYPQSVITEQVQNGVAIRMAVLKQLLAH